MVAVVLILLGAFLTFATAWGLGRALWRGRPPLEILAVVSGAVALSLSVFLLLLAGRVGRRAFVVLAILALVGWLWQGRPAWVWPSVRALGWTGSVIGAVYGAYYAIHALAPEIQPDGVTYHLGLVAEWLRLGRFPARIGFYEMLPQGLEMLFGFAFAFGKHSAAKLVEFGFFLVSVQMLLQLGRRLRFDARPAAILYGCAPVVGISAASSYNDAALVLFLLAVFLLLVLFVQEGRNELLFHAGLAAGFCYAIKVTGLIALPPVIIWLVWRRHWRGLVLFCLGAALSVVPWMLRDSMLTGNPLAPIGNNWFPNEFFHYGSEKYLGEYLRSYGGIRWWQIPWELAAGGLQLQGLFGPALLLLPVGLLALRKSAGRWLLAAAAILAVPWVLNVGARFFMPAFAFGALALCVALPARVAWGVAMLQAVLCLPLAVGWYADPYAWRLKGFPWQAALRVEPEADYLRAHLWEYRLAEMVSRRVPANARLLDLFAIPYAYTPLVPIGTLPSAEFDNLAETLAFASKGESDVLAEWVAEFPEQPVSGVRVRLVGPVPERWGLSEVRMSASQVPVIPQPSWRLAGGPSAADLPLAFDRNDATRWQTWQTASVGDFVEARLPAPVPVDRVGVTAPGWYDDGTLTLETCDAGGLWRTWPVTRRRLSPDLLRLYAAEYLRRMGIEWILVSTAPEGHGLTGRAMAENPEAWGMKKVEDVQGVTLFQMVR